MGQENTSLKSNSNRINKRTRHAFMIVVILLALVLLSAIFLFLFLKRHQEKIIPQFEITRNSTDNGK